MIRLSTCSGRPGPCPACPPFICLEQAFPCLRLTTPSLLSIVGARKMVDWTSPTEITGEADVFGKLIFSLFGLYVWEIFQTSDFDWSIITGKRKFVWPLIAL
ncbi:hypothetical protein PHLCEN_2v10580 [Hermanssonia centrifuga]|uniref:Uncharacterized protein n=1 Tax=Hermanssonia centrifuga TaxID=98765 RepID=A0A2R6NMR7_9APHY|nr:hypothetical protein PHLCEN_2v10580 [Hermanssonia centrifuga]